MGNKQSGKKEDNKSNLHPQEKRRLTDFLEDKQSTAKFTLTEVQKLWHEILAPDLLADYTNFLFKTNHGHRPSIGLNDFISIYVNIIRGSPKEKNNALTRIIGCQKNNAGKEVISYERFCKYLSDLMESFFCGLEHRSDECYESWTQFVNKPQRATIEEVMKGVCNELQHTDDEVKIDAFSKWFNQCGLVNLLHSYVLGSMYNLSPEFESNMVPFAHIPSKKLLSTKWSMLMDLSHVVYLNSFLPSENKEEWRVLYSVDIHGESFAKFVSQIVNQGPILIVVNTSSNHTFGGFISKNVAPSPKWIGSESSFLFKLQPTVEVYPSTGYNNHYGYLNLLQTTLPNGLGMGGQHGYWGLWIDSKFGVGECSESCTTYKNYKMLNSKKDFQIKSLEVWGVGDPPPDDDGTRKKPKSVRSALDQDPTSTQILEMAGREMHSKGFRTSTH